MSVSKIYSKLNRMIFKKGLKTESWKWKVVKHERLTWTLENKSGGSIFNAKQDFFHEKNIFYFIFEQKKNLTHLWIWIHMWTWIECDCRCLLLFCVSEWVFICVCILVAQYLMIGDETTQLKLITIQTRESNSRVNVSNKNKKQK